MPAGYERATGVIEKRFQCIGCGTFFRSGTKLPACPKCQSTRIRDLGAGKTDEEIMEDRTTGNQDRRRSLGGNPFA